MDFTFWQLPNDEEAAIRFFQDAEILHKERLCANNHKMLYRKSLKWGCCKGSCRETKGLRTQTWFYGSRIPFLTAARFIYLWCQELTSIEFCELQLQMNHNTTVDWNNYMREVCANALMSQDKVKIGGSDITIEIKVCLFEGRKSNDERIPPKQHVLGGLCGETNQCFAVVVPDSSAKALMAAIKENVADGSKISSDFWKDYMTHELQDAGYERYTVDHKYNFMDTDTEAEERLWRIKHQRGSARKAKENWMEFMWRCLHPKSERFSAILKDICKFMPAV